MSDAKGHEIIWWLYDEYFFHMNFTDALIINLQ